MEYKKISNDKNGNPRIVVHFLSLLSENELDNNLVNLSLEGKYKLALSKAKKIGGKKFHNKQFGGGIVFICYSVEELNEYIKKLTSKK